MNSRRHGNNSSSPSWRKVASQEGRAAHRTLRGPPRIGYPAENSHPARARCGSAAGGGGGGHPPTDTASSSSCPASPVRGIETYLPGNQALPARKGRVEHWCQGYSAGLSVPAPFGWRCLTSPGMPRTPAPSHRTVRCGSPAHGSPITVSHRHARATGPLGTAA